MKNNQPPLVIEVKSSTLALFFLIFVMITSVSVSATIYRVMKPPTKQTQNDIPK